MEINNTFLKSILFSYFRQHNIREAEWCLVVYIFHKEYRLERMRK